MSYNLPHSVPVAEPLLFQFEYIRQTGVHNMYDRASVRILAMALGFKELVQEASTAQSYSNLLVNYTDPDPARYSAWCREHTQSTEEEINRYGDTAQPK